MNIATLLPKLIPLVVRIVPLVESLFGDKPGDEKRTIAIELIKPAIVLVEAIVGKDLVDEDALAPAIGILVDQIVDIFNQTGAFPQEG